MSKSAIVDLQGSFGVALVGLFISTIFCGVTLTQTWIYYNSKLSREGDPKALKCFIALLAIMDTLHSILCFYTLYWYLILNYGNVASLEGNVWAVKAQVMVNCSVALFVQLFYARRVYILSHNIILPVIIAGTSILSYGLGLDVDIWSVPLRSHNASVLWRGALALSAGAFSDILIAASMSWYLYRKRTGFTKTDSIIVTLMVYSISTGLLTCILGFSTFICFLVMSTGVASQAFFWLICKCYVNSLLFMLNTRDFLRARSTKTGTDSAFAMSQLRKSKSAPTTVTVNVHQSTVTDFPAAGKHSYDMGTSMLELENAV
ncbi:hypothetical protein BJV74DRAFT_156779 [Russula compacta]|nr:hypothetical protein BJV74DRAFT_156779 [Russula compacta]